MTEEQWLTCEDPKPMLDSLRGKADARKLRLFAVACCRRIAHLLVHPVSREAVEIAEQFADGLVSDGERDRVYREADDIRGLIGGVGTGQLDDDTEVEFRDILDAAGVTENVATAAADEAWGAAEPDPEESTIGACAIEALELLFGSNEGDQEGKAQTVFLRDIFGNPFRPVAFDPAWRTDTVTALARTMYDQREFSAMPILADALQDAGCDSADILSHCRGEGTHVRGCWVVDLVLGKE